ncbi:hypothetical protein BP6252_09208 [Coleophoma cylindrospora]|uniref:Vacuolar protein sorting-associated protein 51 homolog n=1 Tax=Coleophoma cylindrospora TaxID=1849047 RepID=A0A3D8R196_9HELO|nr:hypothetical protein BP6252_09208 [Coleophoma cylindrospora]
MSTIAQPRDSSVNGRRIPSIATPTSSSRPSLDIPRSETGSPATNPPARRNRAALREYYNLKKVSESDEIPNSDAASELSSNDHSDVAESELDAADFNAEEYVKHALQSQSLSELLRTYNGVLTDIRALDAEKKALVYDNYSKLIAATETIRKMRMNMDPLNPMASTLDPAIANIYERAQSIKDELKSSLGEGPRQGRDAAERRKARNTAKKVLETPENLRMLVAKGNTEEAKKQWEATRKLLERWRERGVGGQDVAACIEDGDAALRGEPPNEKSWVNVKERRINGGTQ